MPNPTRGEPITSEELLEEEITDLERPIVHSWMAVVGALAIGVVLGSILWGFLATEKKIDRGPRTNSGLQVLTLAEPQGALRGAPARFRWEPVGGASKYIVTVIEEKSDRAVLVRPVSDVTLVPTADESSSFKDGLYSWSVEAQTEDGRTIAQGEAAFQLTKS